MKKIYLQLLAVIFLSHSAHSQCTITGATQSGSNNNATSCVCPAGGGSVCDLIPDISIAKLPLNQTSNYTEYPQVCNPPCNGNDGRLRVGVSTPIIGYGPLESRGTSWYVCGTDTLNAGTVANIPATCPSSGLPPKQLINQRIYKKNGNSMNYWERAAGSMTYHASHGHQHVDDWGIYTLRTNNGNPNPLTWPIVGNGAKLGFCLIDLGTCTSGNGYCTDTNNVVLHSGNISNFGLGGGNYGCNNTVQGITNGSMDTYSQNLDGMWINLPAGVCNGNYWLVVQIDPYNYFLETVETNNVVAVPITLTQQSPNGTAAISANKAMPICNLETVTLTANAGTSYLWNNGATTQSIIVSAAGNYTVAVTSICGVATSSPFNVTTTGPSAPTTTNASSCGAASMTLNATGTGTIKWYGQLSGGNLLFTGSNYNTPVLNNTTTYYADATTTTGGTSLYCPPVANTIGGGGQYTGSQHQIFNVANSCTLKSVKIYANVAGTFTVQLQNSLGSLIASSSVTVPAGESRITLNYPLTIGTGYRLTRSGSFSLYRNNGGVSYPYNISGFVSITGSSGGSAFYYFFYDWEVQSLVQTCTSSRASATATVNTVPTVSVSADNTSICTGQSAVLTASGASTYNWSPSTGLSSTTGNPVTASPTSTTTYTVVGTHANGCTDSEVITIQYNVGPVPNQPGGITGLAKVCPGSVNVAYSIATVSGATNYSWTPPAGVIVSGGAGTNSVTVNFDPSFISGSLCVTANNLCGSSIPKCKTINRDIPAKPSSITGEIKGVCNSTQAYIATTVSGATLYTWTFPASTSIISGQGTSNAQIQFQAGFVTGSICVAASNYCGSSAARCVTVKSVPAGPASITGPTTVCQNQTNVAYSITPLYGATSYTWTKPSTVTFVSGQGTANAVFNWGLNSGSITVKGVNACGNGNSKTATVTVNCKVADANELSSSFALSPNPANSKVDITVYSDINGNSVISLSDLLGRNILSDNVEMTEGYNTATLNLKEIAKGIYIVSLDQDGKRISRKLVVE